MYCVQLIKADYIAEYTKQQSPYVVQIVGPDN